MPWLRVAPGGFRRLLNWISKRYKLPIIVTENGCPCVGEKDVKVAVDGEFRQQYLGLYLVAISRAIYEDGVKVKGYYAWSLVDNFEWATEYGPRYGIVHCYFETLKRTPKNSAWYLRSNFKKRRETSWYCSNYYTFCHASVMFFSNTYIAPNRHALMTTATKVTRASHISRR
jgi:beta-glucosidase